MIIKRLSCDDKTLESLELMKLLLQGEQQARAAFIPASFSASQVNRVVLVSSYTIRPSITIRNLNTSDFWFVL